MAPCKTHKPLPQLHPFIRQPAIAIPVVSIDPLNQVFLKSDLTFDTNQFSW